MFDDFFPNKEEKERFAKGVLETAMHGNTHDSIIAGNFILSVIVNVNERENIKKEE